MFKKFKLKKYSLIFLPEGTDSAPKTIKLSFGKMLSYFLIYSMLVFFIGFYAISFTPFGEVIFPYSLRLGESDKKKIELLNKKIIFLAQEIESLKAANKKLKFAIMLADPTLIDTSEIKKDSTKPLPIGGDILRAVSNLFGLNFFKQNKTVLFIKPVEGFISRSFDPAKGHNGIDFVLKENNPVVASAGGFVIFADYTPGYGYTIIINHPDNYITKYLHCASLIKKEGENVKQGELIALSGNSGTESSGPHLHFEIWKDGKPVNPSDLLINF